MVRIPYRLRFGGICQSNSKQEKIMALCVYKDSENCRVSRESFVDPKLVGIQVNFGDKRIETEIIAECVKLGVVPARSEDDAAINEAVDIGEYYVGWGQDRDGNWPGYLVTFKTMA